MNLKTVAAVCLLLGTCPAVAGLNVDISVQHHIIWLEINCASADSIRLWVNGELVGRGKTLFALPTVYGNRYRIKLAGENQQVWEMDSVISSGGIFLSKNPLMKQALDSLNSVRLRLSVPVARLDSSLCAAALSHARYLAKNWDYYVDAKNPLSVHQEIRTKPGFTGVHCWDRAERFGYNAGSMWVSEVIAFEQEPVLSVRDWLNTVYHRLPLLDPDMVELGFGASQPRGKSYGIQVMNLAGYPLAWPVNRPFLVVYPYPGQTDVPARMSPEFPDPAPDIQTKGYPITVQFPACFEREIRVVDIRLYNAKGQQVKTRLLRSDNDNMLSENEFACLPEQSLETWSRYKVVLDYTWRDSLGRFEWEFNTGW